MNYRHAYHAGNFADVLKHVVLALVIEYMKLKDAPFRVIDTHAGPGRYSLLSDEALKTGEWHNGIARLIGRDAAPLGDEIAALLAPFLNIVRTDNPAGDLTSYPGSPWLARQLIRPGDKLVVNELHPDDNEALARLFARDLRLRDRQVSVLAIDGWTALKSLLPPPERRAVVLVDPPFEQPGELDRLVRGLQDATKRFSTGTFILWYPIKAQQPVTEMQHRLTELGLSKLLRIELLIHGDLQEDRLNGCGLIVHNPPYILMEQLQSVLPELAKRLAADGNGQFRLNWLVP